MTVVGGAGGVVTALGMAALLFLLAEVSFAAIETVPRSRYERPVVGRRIATIVLLLVGALAVDALLLLGVSEAPAASRVLTILGAVAAVAVFAILVALHVRIERSEGGRPGQRLGER